jgi:hypothetical protein
VHDLLALDTGREQACEDARQIMNLALADMLFALGWVIRPAGAGGVWIATGRRPSGEGAAG